MKKSIQDKIDEIMKLAQSSGASYSVKKKKYFSNRQDSLLRIIRNQKEADTFMAELNAIIKLAQEKQD